MKKLSCIHISNILLLKTDGDLRRTIRDALISMTSAFMLNKENETGISLIIALLSAHIESPESYVS